MHMCHNSDYQSEKVGTTDAALNQSTFGPYYGGHGCGILSKHVARTH